MKGEPMGDCMNFPDTVDEYMEQYKMTDVRQVYSNGIEYVPIFRMKQWFEHEKDQPTIQPEKAQLSGKDTTDAIYRKDAIEVAKAHWYKPDIAQALAELPPAQSPPISEMYAKAVRSWLVNYQVKLAELDGRYTPYEVLGWVVSDWRKENGIW